MTDVTTIPTQFKAPPHLFGDHVYLPEQTERTCKVCGLTKITMHGDRAQAWRGWRFADGSVTCADAAPQCLPAGEKAAT